jgi:hypothetical protein
VDAGDVLRAHKTDVDAADTNYIPLIDVGVANGVANLDLNGDLLASQLPSGIMIDRPVLSYSIGSTGTIYLGSGNSQLVATTTSRELLIASMVIPDPGFAWYPMSFAWVYGYAYGADNGRFYGNNNYGQLVVQPPAGISDTIYAAGIGPSDVRASFTPVIPSCPVNPPGTTPSTQPPINGSLELDLYGSCFSGSGYVWMGIDLVWYTFIYPSM